ncbi:uncharacterized protein LOC144660686 [Oculina patagonica]
MFATLTNLNLLDLSYNGIQNLPKDLVTSLRKLEYLSLQNNMITSISNETFSGYSILEYINLSYNRIRYLSDGLFRGFKNLKFLFLQYNMITFISNKTFARSTIFKYLVLSANQLNTIPHRAFFYVHNAFWEPQTAGISISSGNPLIKNPQKRISYLIRLEQTIMLSDNPINKIEPEAFRRHNGTLTIYLLRTQLKILSLESFFGFGSLNSQLVIKNRTVGTIKYHWYNNKSTHLGIIYLNPINSDTEAVRLKNFDDHQKEGEAIVSALLESGFRRVPGNSIHHTYLPCPLGTFSNSSSKGAEGCIECPSGGFYSDSVGHVAEGCKKCPTGSFIPFDKTPGTRRQDCETCPEGTDTDFFAGYRACRCLKGFYRTHMFEECHKCVRGLKCQDDYAFLKFGYWWDWRNDTHMYRYRYFIKNLLTLSPALDAASVQFRYPIPTPFKCPREESCKGGLDSPCDNGYHGPLCAVCTSGYYKRFQSCTLCPTRRWMIGQLSILAVSVVIITAILVWTSKRKINKTRAQPLIDVLLSKLKIVIGFYQVTYGLLQAFSYIKWPGSLQGIAKYSEILQMNVFQISPVHCFFPRLHAGAFGTLFAIMTINAFVIVISVVAYEVRKVVVLRSRGLGDEEQLRKISETKELMFRNMFFFLYVTYLSTCSATANVLPPACQKICRDNKEDLCYKYLKADYSIQCQGAQYNHALIAAYISISYIVSIPVASFVALWKQKRVILAPKYSKTSQDTSCGKEMIEGLRFLFENYKARSWYWELVEMSRKVILTSGLILVGQETRSYIGFAWVIAGMYGMLFAWIKPVQDVMDNRLMTISLAVTVVNLGVGAVSRIPAENISASIDPYTDEALFNLLVLGANTLVVGLLVVQYALFLYRYLKEWRKNPYWSFSCCLALLLPLNDLQGELRGMIETDVLKRQLQTGHIERPTILSALKDSGAIDVTLEDGKHDDDYTAAVHDDDCEDAENKNGKCHQWTQTEPITLSLANIVVHEEVGELQQESLNIQQQTSYHELSVK